MPETTLRDALNDAVSQHEETGQPAAEPQAEQPAEPAQAQETEKPKGAGRTEGRARDEKGRLLPGKAQKESAEQPEIPAQPQVAKAQVPAPASAEVKKINRPSSWKKDHWESFDKIAQENPALAEYINQREGEYAKGVSAYKTELDNAKPILEALAPHLPLFQQHGINPAQQIDRYLKVHQVMAFGSPEQKLAHFMQWARDYNVPIQNLLQQGQDGRFYWNQQLMQQQAQQQQQPALDINAVKSYVREELTNERTAQLIAEFERQAPEKYPHYATVKATMAGLLQSGLAEDLPSAYEAALRMPQHAEIFEQMQAEQRAQAEAKRKEEAAKAVQRARSNAVSVKSASGTSGTQNAGRKGLRDSISEAMEAHGGGRV